MELFDSLKLSYSALRKPTLQKVLVFCSLINQDKEDKEVMICRLIANKLTGGLESRETEFDDMDHSLDLLEDVGLLQLEPHMMRMQGVVRVMGNRYFEDSFFQYFSGLEVLDLSSTSIVRLPRSACDLVNLISLNVSSCEKLKDLPPVSKLVSLKKLDASYSGIDEVPHGMEFLIGLNYLNLIGTGIYMLPDGLLPNLSGLQCLMLNWVGNGVELAALKDLEILKCGLQFPSLSESAHMWNVIERLKLNRYSIRIQNKIIDGDDDLLSEHPTTYSDLGVVYSKVIKFEGVLVYDYLDLPTSVECLDIHDVSSIIWKSILPQSCAGLRCLCISDCDDLNYLCCFPSSSSSGFPFENIEILELTRLRSFRFLFAAPSPEANVPLSPGVFCHLRKLDINDCPKIVKLFPPNLLSNLQNLEQLMVSNCDAMEVIFEDKDDNIISKSYSTGILNLPKLKILQLVALPQLQRISSEKISCESLQMITLSNCVNLHDISIHLPITFIECVSVHPKEWWHTVNWENKNSLPLGVIHQF